MISTLTNHIMYPFGSISMPTPYMNRKDMLWIRQAYSEDNSAPWHFEHRGIDFSPRVHLAPFQAVFSGVIEVVDLFENVTNENISYWHVNMKLVHDAVWSAWYAFEPMMTSRVYGEEQLFLVAVLQGDRVQTGDLLGNLYDASPGAHVHFTLNKNDEPVCPEPYFNPKARASILDLIHKVDSDWKMCYH